jgi:hypothetical protein
MSFSTIYDEIKKKEEISNTQDYHLDEANKEFEFILSQLRCICFDTILTTHGTLAKNYEQMVVLCDYTKVMSQLYNLELKLIKISKVFNCSNEWLKTKQIALYAEIEKIIDCKVYRYFGDILSSDFEIPEVFVTLDLAFTPK